MEIDHSWSLQEAIRRQVEKEDMLGWALKEGEALSEREMRREIKVHKVETGSEA
jgi:hypothetical protein